MLQKIKLLVAIRRTHATFSMRKNSNQPKTSDKLQPRNDETAKPPGVFSLCQSSSQADELEIKFSA